MARGPDKQFDREQVLRRAMDLFWEQGFEATGIAELTEHMGIGRQSLYDTFGNKRELYLEVLRHYARGRAHILREILMAEGSPKANLFRALHEGRRMNREGCGCMLGNTTAEVANRDPEVAAIVRDKFRDLRAAFAETLRRARDAGEVPAHMDPGHVASLLVAMIQGAALMTKLEGDAFIDEIIAALTSILEVRSERAVH